jgi:hypothetical protein
MDAIWIFIATVVVAAVTVVIARRRSGRADRD